MTEDTVKNAGSGTGGMQMYHKSGLPWTRYWDFILLDMAVMFVSQIIAYYLYIPTDFMLSGSPE